MAKPWWKSKTAWFNILVIAAEILERLLGLDILPNETLPFVAALNVALRAVTQSPITWR